MGIKKTYKNNYNFSSFEGNFGISGNIIFGEDSVIRGKINSDTPYFKVGAFNDVNTQIQLDKVLEGAKLTLGNFTKFAFDWSFNESSLGNSGSFFFQWN